MAANQCLYSAQESRERCVQCDRVLCALSAGRRYACGWVGFACACMMAVWTDCIAHAPMSCERARTHTQHTHTHARARKNTHKDTHTHTHTNTHTHTHARAQHTLTLSVVGWLAGVCARTHPTPIVRHSDKSHLKVVHVHNIVGPSEPASGSLGSGQVCTSVGPIWTAPADPKRTEPRSLNSPSSHSLFLYLFFPPSLSSPLITPSSLLSSLPFSPLTCAWTSTRVQ